MKVKDIKVSTIDPDSGFMHRDNKQKGFMYLEHRTVENKNALILDAFITSGNVHDATPYIKRLNYIIDKFGVIPKSCALDSGYHNRQLMKHLVENGIFTVISYRRFPRNKTMINRVYFCYEESTDSYICPNNQILSKTTINREGYRMYKNPKACKQCPIREKCLGNSTYTHRTITRHIDAKYDDIISSNRKKDYGKYLMQRRKETVERSFGDAKRNHGYRYTNLKGKVKIQDNTWLLAAAQNMKKIALSLSKKQEKALSLIWIMLLSTV